MTVETLENPKRACRKYGDYMQALVVVTGG